jgi:hypothetical protein
VEFAFALGAVGLPLSGKGIGLDAGDVLEVDLDPIDGTRALGICALGARDDVDVLRRLAAEVQTGF